MIHLYGIPNCDTVKKARVWLDAQGRAYTFHDYKKEGADPERIAGWIDAAGLDVVVNRKGTTFRALSDDDKARAADAATAPALLAANGLSPAAFFRRAWPAIQLGFVSRSSIATVVSST